MSVDLVGSTAYKAGAGRQILSNAARQRWVDETRHFYREFPRYLEKEFRNSPIIDEAHEGNCPQIWKTVGDEIVFCIKLEHSQHLGRCVWSFIKSLDNYSRYLEAASIELDVKGVAWTAAFPVPNVTVPVSLKHSDNSENMYGLQDHDLTESEADKTPSSFEFLGKDIDAGFRVARHSSSDRLALSVETAYLLAKLCAEGKYSFPFTYAGRESMKGVISNRPYPLLAIDTERREFRRQVQAYEQAISGEKNAQPHLLMTFLEALMKDERIEYPFLSARNEIYHESDYPKTYREFRSLWISGAKEEVQRKKVEEQSRDAEEVAEPDPDSLTAIQDNAQEILRRFREPG